MVFFFPNLNVIFADFKKVYNMEVGQSLFLGKKYLNNAGDLFYDRNRLKLDNCGFLTALEECQTDVFIKENENSNKISINLNITPQKNIKFLFLKPFSCNENSDLNFCVATLCNKDIKRVKVSLFDLEEKNYVTVTSEEKNVDNGLYVWNFNLGKLNKGDYIVRIFIFASDDCNLIESEQYYLSVANSFSYNVNINEKGFKFIVDHEGFSGKIYYDVSGSATIGYGRVVHKGEVFRNEITKLEAQILLRKNIDLISKRINIFLINNDIVLSQDQLNALISFTYNVGEGWFRNYSEIKEMILNAKSDEYRFKRVEVKTFLNVRKDMSVKSEVISKLYKNEIVRVLEENNEWTKIKSSDGKIGYCNNTFLRSLYNLDSIDKKKFTEFFLNYHHANKKCVLGLFFRRIKELDIFFRGEYHDNSLSSTSMKNKLLNNYPVPLCIKNIFYK